MIENIRSLYTVEWQARINYRLMLNAIDYVLTQSVRGLKVIFSEFMLTMDSAV